MNATCSTCGAYLLPTDSGGVCSKGVDGKCENGRIQPFSVSAAKLAYALQVLPHAEVVGQKTVINHQPVRKAGQASRMVEFGRKTGPNGELLGVFGGSRGGKKRVFQYALTRCQNS